MEFLTDFLYDSCMKRNDTSWNEVANWYDDLLSDPESYQQKVILPNLIRLLGNVKDKHVLDLGCGQGFFSHAFSRNGADVTGVDLSQELIALAREHSNRQGTFVVGSAEKLPTEIGTGAFDTAVCVLALQNIKNLDAAIGEGARALKTGGAFHIVLNHPAFRIPKRSSWGFDDTAGIQYRRLDGYLSESSHEIVMHPGKEEKSTTSSFHRPLQLYFKSFAKHGFVVNRLEEWISHKESEPGSRKFAEDRARKEFPLFLYLGLIRM